MYLWLLYRDTWHYIKERGGLRDFREKQNDTTP